MNTPYPTLNFGLGEDIDMLREHVYQFSQGQEAQPPRRPRGQKLVQRVRRPQGQL